MPLEVNQKLKLKDLADAIELAETFDHVPNATMADSISRVHPNLNVSPIVLESYGGKTKSEVLNLLLEEIRGL